VPVLLGWTDPFIDSLAFSVMLHLGTLVALLVYFRWDWLRLVPAALATIRDRSFRGDPDRRLAWLIMVTTVPAIVAGLVLNDPIETVFRDARLVAVTLVIGGALLWLADRQGSRRLGIADIGFRLALLIGVGQAAALVPGISRSGISISAGLAAGLRREPAARFSFLMATPITAMAGAYETLKLIRGDTGLAIQVAPLAVGMLAATISGLAAIAVLLRFLRTNPTTVFVAYRLVLAFVIVAWWLSLGR
jgi:undecaprenyl-diphosphatase